MSNRMWLKLDNAAKIYPAARRRNWNNMFRVSCTLKEKVDTGILSAALKLTAPRFPSISVRLRRGAFWYYLEQLDEPPEIREDSACPLADIKFSDIRKCAYRVLYYGNRIAVEIYHALTDGNGGLVFLKTLVATYLELRHGIDIPHEKGILDIDAKVPEEELEDSFVKYSGPVRMSRREPSAYHIKGKREDDGYLDLTTGIFDTKELLSVAREKGVTITEYISSALIMAILEIQKIDAPISRKRDVKILVPVNLRKIFKSRTMRNFVLFVTPGIDPKLGEYSFDEVLQEVHNQMHTDVTPKKMASRIAANVQTEQVFILRLMPLFIKNLAMKLVYNMVGETKACLTCSNLGNVTCPSEMERYIERFDFILGAQATQRNNCSVLSYDGKTYLSLTRNIEEPKLEYHFFRFLKEQGLNFVLQSNIR